jgi:hypothetical protein
MATFASLIRMTAQLIWISDGLLYFLLERSFSNKNV